MSLKFIAIAYDNETAAEGDQIDLYSDLVNTFNNAHVKVSIVECDDPGELAGAALTLADSLKEEGETA